MKQETDYTIYSKVPPQARQLEESVLGAILVDKNCFDVVNNLINPGCFYVDANSRIFKAMQLLNTKSNPIDILTVCEQLAKSEELDLVGGRYYVTQLTNITYTANVEAHARYIYEKWLLREQIRICGQGLTQAYDESTDAFDGLDNLQKSFNDLATVSVKTAATPISNLLIERFSRIEELRHRPDHLTGIPTGFKPLDLLTAGWQATDLIIIAARPSVGKTAFALNLARNAAQHRTKPTPVAFFSLEMSKGQLTDRLLSSESGINLDLITRAKMNDDMMAGLYEKGLQPLSGYSLHIDDTAALNIYELKSRCRKLKHDENIGLIIIDYLQLMSGISEQKSNKSSNREQEIATISRGLKALAKELKIPIIALSQLSRNSEQQKRDPILSDLRESGAIEQDADMVMFLTRPDYQQTDMQDESVTNYADIHIKKHRNGDLAKLPMRTMLNIQRWMTNEEYDLYNFNASSRNFKPLNDEPF